MTRARDIASGADFSTGIDAGEVIPHIIPGVLYPAVADKMLDGTTSLSASTTGPNSSTVASSKYGTVQSDGRMYYYTSIKGSKPIKDPRIGGHFGSQRHKTKSLQLLEQETATHGKNVYSVDGREWIRGSGDGELTMNVGTDSSNGMLVLTANKNSYIEIVGYFSDMNVMSYTATNRDWRYTLDGATENTTDYGSASVGSPLTLRYVDSGALINLGLGATLGIHTIKITSKETVENVYLFCIELIAQDTSSTANKSKIQIPSQNVVSYGKKFTVSGTPHYDPFNGFTSGNLAAVKALIDTDTSLGMANWLSSSTYYRPFNGGRVVKWVDSSGNIKTSVTIMPPNAQNCGTSGGAGTASNAIDLSSSQTNDDIVNFNTGVIDHSFAEVAKTWNWHEFGNGGANQGTTGSYADASMLNNTVDDISYVMDDGLTSLSGKEVKLSTTTGTNEFVASGDDDYWFFTFIGCGFGGTGSDNESNATGKYKFNFVQNLPYGTHVFKTYRSGQHPTVTIDGVEISTDVNLTGHDYCGINDFTVYQPKMPPIPEDAVIIADYMLTADYVRQTSSGIDKISKGVRRVNASRDMFYNEDTNATFSFWIPPDFASSSGYAIEGNTTISSGNMYCELPYFGTDVVVRTRGDRQGTDVTEYINSTSLGTITKSATSATYGEYIYAANTPVLGLNGCKVNASSTSPSRFFVTDLEINTPIHTSSHYQTFETPYLKELVGGDRNMEQNNLIVTPDGKTWDEVTRDTSYIGKTVLSALTDTDNDSTSTINIFDDWRGIPTNTNNPCFNKDFAIAYDRFICLVDGQYEIVVQTLGTNGTQCSDILLNGSSIAKGNCITANETVTTVVSRNLVRGDYIQIKGSWYESIVFNNFHIKRV